MEGKGRRIRAVASLFVVSGIALGGCASTNREVVSMKQQPYEKTIYQTVEVQRGDLNPSITLTLSMEGYERIQYDSTNEDLELDTLHVSVGDKVKKGDILVSFESESIRRTIEQYEDDKRQKELLVEHYGNLMKIDQSVDYNADIAMLREDIQVASLYIEEAQNELAGYQIIAKEDGTITRINEYLRNGYYMPGKALLTEVCGSGNYSASTREPDVFTVGEVYTVSAGVASYDLRLRDITDQTLTFEPVSDMSSVSDSAILTLTVEKPPITDVLYVDTDAVVLVESEEGDSYYVHRIKENGYREAVLVTVGEQTDDYIVITSGVEVGEKVTLE